MSKLLSLLTEVFYLLISVLYKQIYRVYRQGRYWHYKRKGLNALSNPFNSSVRLTGSEYMTIGCNTHFGSKAILECWNEFCGQKFSPSIIIGANCSFGEYVHITAINKIEIGNGVLCGRFVLVSDNNHGDSNSLQDNDIIPSQRPLTTKGSIRVGNNVWIGDKATILGGVCIGEGAIIAASSVVTKDVPPFSVVVGNPARIIRRMSE